MIFYQETEFSVAFLIGTTLHSSWLEQHPGFMFGAPLFTDAQQHHRLIHLCRTPFKQLFCCLFYGQISALRHSWNEGLNGKTKSAFLFVPICVAYMHRFSSQFFTAGKRLLTRCTDGRRKHVVNTPELVSSEYEEADSISGWSVWT